MNKILYISRSGLPIDAAGIRTYNIGSILEKLGKEVHYIADYRVNKKILGSGYEQICGGALDTNEVHFAIDKKVYSYLPQQKKGKLYSLLEIAELLYAKKAYRRVVSYCEKEKPEAIFLYNETYPLTKKLMSYCKKHDIKVYADITEWYEMDKNKNFAERFVVTTTEKRITKLDRHLDGIIAISAFFEDYYKSVGANVVRIPPLMEIQEGLEIKKHEYYEDTSVLNFVYAGSPGGKDILLPFVKALQKVNREGIRARLDIAGIDEKYFERFSDIDQNLESTGVFAHGRLSHEQTLDIVRKADFGILFRYDKRYAKAGFSTKLSECMSVGAAMMCNKIGGCDLCIEHMVNGILTESADGNVLAGALENLLSKSCDDILRMKRNAYEYAKENFDAEKHVNTVKTLMGC